MSKDRDQWYSALGALAASLVTALWKQIGGGDASDKTAKRQAIDALLLASSKMIANAYYLLPLSERGSSRGATLINLSITKGLENVPFMTEQNRAALATMVYAEVYGRALDELHNTSKHAAEAIERTLARARKHKRDPDLPPVELTAVEPGEFDGSKAETVKQQRERLDREVTEIRAKRKAKK